MDILSKNHYYCNGQSIQVPRLHQRGVNENYQNIGCCFLRVYTFLDLNDLLWRYGKILIAASTANLFMGVFLPQYKLYLIRLSNILDKSQNIIFLVCNQKMNNWLQALEKSSSSWIQMENLHILALKWAISSGPQTAPGPGEWKIQDHQMLFYKVKSPDCNRNGWMETTKSFYVLLENTFS